MTKQLSRKDKQEFTALAEIAEGRANLYRFFGGFYGDVPTKKSLAKMASDEFVAEMTGLFGKRATQPLRTFAEKYKPAEYDTVVREYQELFVVPIERKFVTPYESVYLTGLMLQDPHAQVKKSYEKAGVSFAPAKAVNLEDHISGEMGFMQYLAAQESKAWKKSKPSSALNFLRYEVDFLENHMTLWINDFCEKLEGYAIIPIYKGIAKMTAKFIDLDYTQAADILEAEEKRDVNK